MNEDDLLKEFLKRVLHAEAEKVLLWTKDYAEEQAYYVATQVYDNVAFCTKETLKEFADPGFSKKIKHLLITRAVTKNLLQLEIEEAAIEYFREEKYFVSATKDFGNHSGSNKNNSVLGKKRAAPKLVQLEKNFFLTLKKRQQKPQRLWK